MSCLKNGEAEHNLYTQHRDLGSECECDSRRNRDRGSVGINISPCQGGNCGEERVSTAPISVRDRAEDMVGNMKPDVKSKKARQQKKMTLEDMYNNQYDFDDEDDDSDWEPVQKPAAVVKWFCVNCTMVNLGDDSHCDICGEHKESGILKHGYFASPFLKEAGLSQNELEVKERYKDPCSQISESGKFTAVGFDERMLLHSEVEMKSHPHPERPDRLRAITASLATAGIFPGRCFPISAREITEEELHMVHSLEHIQSVELTSQLLASYFTPDTYANEHSARAARLAAGLCADLASEILSGHAKNGFALVRPPGHHAGIRQAMGFCLHNNAAVAALAAQGVGAKRVLIVDWDVHHGNGTQEIFDGSKMVLYISLHRHEGGKFYPGTGAAHEVGSMGAEGYCVNVPWSRGGVGDNDYLFAFQHVVLPIASAFSPDFIIISAGFDAARGDPLGCCDVTPSGFAQMTHALNALSGGKLLVILEGGYNLRSISSSATAVIKVLLGESPGCEAENVVPSKSGLLTVMEVLKIQMKFWPTLEPVLLKLNLQWGTYALPNRTGNANKRPRREPAYVRTAEINRVLGYTGEPGTRTAGRGRDASVLLGYDPAYKGFTDRRLAHPSISAASTSTVPQQPNTRLNPGVTIASQASEVPISEGVPLPRVVLRRSSRRQAVPQQQTEQSAPILDTNQSSSFGYSRSPRDSGNMSRQPLNLSTLLTIPSRGRGASGRVSSTGHVPPPPRRNRRGSTRSSSSPRERGNSLEASDAHRDKRPRNQEAGASDAQATVSTLENPSPNIQVSHEAWTPQLVRGDRPVNVGDSASSSETALALAQGLLLPVDMQKESSSSSDRLVSTGLVSGIKFIQKMITLGQKFQEAEAERIRLLNENTSFLRSVTRLEKERDKAKLETEGVKGKLDIAEDNLRQALAEIDSTKKAAYDDGYQKGFDAATASYVEQMPLIQDQIWVASWETCLTKVGVAEDSPLWVENDLPSNRDPAAEDPVESPVDDVEMQIDEFADVEEETQLEAPSNPFAGSPVRETVNETINLEEQADGSGDVGATATAANDTLPGVQNVD